MMIPMTTAMMMTAQTGALWANLCRTPAADWVADVLPGGDDDGEDDEDSSGVEVVQTVV